jgi:hypothetical protein
LQPGPQRDCLVGKRRHEGLDGLSSGVMGSTSPWPRVAVMTHSRQYHQSQRQQQQPSPGVYDHMLRVITPLQSWRPEWS